MDVYRVCAVCACGVCDTQRYAIRVCSARMRSARVCSVRVGSVRAGSMLLGSVWFVVFVLRAPVGKAGVFRVDTACVL